MRRILHVWPALLVGLLITSCSQIVGSAQTSNQGSTATMSLTDLHNISDLQARFNQDAGKPRLLLLVSPT